MAVTDQPKYMWIPPPPLPEFYLSKEQLEKKKGPLSSSSSGTEAEGDVFLNEKKKSDRVTFEKQSESEKAERQPPAAVDGTYDGLPPPSYRYTYTGTPPAGPQSTAYSAVPPLAIYHICRICLKPRSAKYHREHPIPLDGVPPPPGICRRCRVTSVKESCEFDVSDVDEVVRKGKSNDINIGFITPFVPEEAIISNEDAKKMQAERYLRGRSRERHITIFREKSSESSDRRQRSKSRRSDIVYRHVRVLEEPGSRHKTAVGSAAQGLPRKDDSGLHTRLRYSERREESTSRKVETQTQDRGESRTRQTLKSTNLARMDSPRASLSSQKSSLTSRPNITPTPKVATTEDVVLKRPERSDSDIRRIAGEEARWYASHLRKNERTESDIRRIAHEEVERYREAERKLDARPGAFSHGGMVPVRRQSEKESDRPSPVPWDNASKAKSPVTAKEAPKPPEPEFVQSVRSNSYCKSESRTRSDRESWGPQWRRELSLERRRSNETREERWKVDVTEETRDNAYARIPDLAGRDEPRSAYDVVPEADNKVDASGPRQSARSNVSKQPTERSNVSKRCEEANMGLLFPPDRRSAKRPDVDREREILERLSVRSPGSRSQREAPSAVSDKRQDQGYWEKSDITRSAITHSSRQWETSGSGGTPHDNARSSGRPWERGSEEHAQFLVEKEHSERSGRSPSDQERKPTETRQPSDVQYEYKLHTVRPANAVESDRAHRSASPGHVTLEIWQQVPTDPVQRAREAPLIEQERDDAVAWLTKRINDPATQVGRDSDGSRRVACSIAPRDSVTSRQRSPDGYRRPSPRQTAPVRNRSPPQQRRSPADLPPELRGGGGSSQSPVQEKTIRVWEQVPTEVARRYRRQQSPSYRSRDQRPFNDNGLPNRDITIQAWKQVPKERRPSDTSGRRDSAMDAPSARRRRERRGHLDKASDESAHVKFSNKVEISPTPPGSDESSTAFQRFHDFVGRKAGRQIDGHESEERGEDLIAEYERRGRLRSREPVERTRARDYGYTPSGRDETVRPRPSGHEGRGYDGRRDEEWRPLQRALSESPSREWDERKTASGKRGKGPPYHADERPTGSMTTRDGSRSPWR